MNVEKASKLRRRLPRREGASISVIKNTLHKRALKEHGDRRRSMTYLEGPTGIAFGPDEVARRRSCGLCQGAREAGRSRPRSSTARCIDAGRNQEAGAAASARGAAGPVHGRTSLPACRPSLAVLTGSAAPHGGRARAPSGKEAGVAPADNARAAPREPPCRRIANVEGVRPRISRSSDARRYDDARAVGACEEARGQVRRHGGRAR